MIIRVFLVAVLLIISSNAYAFEVQADSSKNVQQANNGNDKSIKSLYYEKNQFIRNMKRDVRDIKNSFNKEKHEKINEYKHL